MNRTERAVQDLLDATAQTRPDVEVDAIAEHLNLTVVRTVMDDDVSGMLIRDTATGVNTVGLNRSHALTRRRFTLAHEIGHFTLHRGRALIVDSPVRVNLRDRTSGMATDREEMEANRFAAELLMPTNMVLDEVARSRQVSNDALPRLLAPRFKVSEQAMGYRLINLGVISPAD